MSVSQNHLFEIILTKYNKFALGIDEDENFIHKHCIILLHHIAKIFLRKAFNKIIFN